jgi:hypothetical protein
MEVCAIVRAVIQRTPKSFVAEASILSPRFAKPSKENAGGTL